MVKGLVLSQLPKAPSYLLGQYATFLCGVAAAYLTCLVFFGPNGLLRNAADAALAAAAAYGTYRVVDAATHRALRLLRVEAPAEQQQQKAGGVAAGGSAGGGAAGGMPDLSALLGAMGGGGGGGAGGGGMPDIGKLMADPAFAKMAEQMAGGMMAGHQPPPQRAKLE